LFSPIFAKTFFEETIWQNHTIQLKNGRKNWKESKKWSVKDSENLTRLKKVPNGIEINPPKRLKILRYRAAEMVLLYSTGEK
jgi:hypothetical protein